MTRSLHSGMPRIISSFSTCVMRNSLARSGRWTWGRILPSNCFLLGGSCLTQDMAALNTSSSFCTLTSSLPTRLSISLSESRINSSVCETSTNRRRAKRCDDSSNSEQMWASAKARIPKQFDGWSVSHTVQLEETRCRQQWLNVVLANFDTRRVTKLDKKLQGCRIDTLDGNFSLATFKQFAGEHSVEIRTTGSQHESVGRDSPLICRQDVHITKFSLPMHCIHEVESFLGMRRAEMRHELCLGRSCSGDGMKLLHRLGGRHGSTEHTEGESVQYSANHGEIVESLRRNSLYLNAYHKCRLQ